MSRYHIDKTEYSDYVCVPYTGVEYEEISGTDYGGMRVYLPAGYSFLVSWHKFIKYANEADRYLRMPESVFFNQSLDHILRKKGLHNNMAWME